MSRLPLTSPYPPMSRRPSVARDPRRRWALTGSVLLHLLALAALLVTHTPEPPMPIAPSYDLLFENGGASTPPTAPNQALDTPSEAPAADLPPTPEAEPPAARATPVPPVLEPPAPPPDVIQPEPPAPAPAAPPQPAPQLEPAPAPSPEPPAARPGPAAPEPNAAPEMAEPKELPQPVPAPNPEPPAVRLAEPEPITRPVTPQTLAPDLPPLAPPAQPPPTPTPPRPRQQAQQRPAPGTFAAPMDLSFGRAAARAPAPRATGSSRAIDFSLGAPKTGPNKSEAFFDIRAANIGADWAQCLAVYWRQHRYFPQQAAQSGEDGTVEIQIVVNRLGRVESVEIKRRSGSPWLDMAAVGTWRNAQLAPLPAENTDPTITIPLTINYVLLR
jgi:TonB family protein